MKRALVLFPLMLAGCHEDMVQQPRYDHYESAALFPNGQAMQAPPEGTVDLAQPARDAASGTPPRVTRALLLRGQQRFDIFCAVCHGQDARGNGVIPSRGFPHPPNLLAPDKRALADRQIFDVITNGYGIMYAYGDRVPPQDRWAIVGWLRVLQAAQPVGDDWQQRARAQQRFQGQEPGG
jgi:mono/diheme cytochrome c family protein